MSRDLETQAHREWLGYLQPVGLVVSPPALVAAGAYPNKNIIPDHARFLECVENITLEGEPDPRPAIRQFAPFATQVLGWEPADLVGTSEGGPLPDSLEVTLTEYNETLRPTYAVREFSNTPGGDAKWLLLYQKVTTGISLDDTAETPDHRWQASPQARFERLLRGTQVPIGLLSNGVSLRLVYAPHGETSGHLTFPVQAMTEVAGRPIFAALHMLLSAERLFTLPDKQRLPAHSRREPEVPEPRLDQAGRAGAGGSVRVAARLPGRRRPATRRLAPRRAEGRPQPGLCGLAPRPVAAGVHPLRRGPFAPLE